jgi:glycosyltransferase involved in cell wall biosynthesis
MRDILCFSSSDWHGKWGSRQQVMLRFARRGHRVLFVERSAVLEHLLRYPDLRQRKRRRWREGLQQIRENLWIVSPPPLLPGQYYSAAVNRINQSFTAQWLRRHLRRLGFASLMLWFYRPEQGALIGRFEEELSVYHCIDEFTAGTTGRKRRTIAALEAELLKSVDLVFANSLLTYENKRRLNPHTYRIPSGADVDHFAQALDPGLSVHPAIADISAPIAGYVGNINDKLSVPLLAAVAADLPDWQFIFVGQAYPQLVDLVPLQSLPNVRFLGRFAFKEVPALVKGMDVCLLPYVSGELARYRSPLKLYEYLAAGKPVVSTDHPEVRELSEWVEIADGARGFAAAIVRARDRDSFEIRGQRTRWSQQHAWDHRVDEMERILTTFQQGE